jgi:uncharacterized protein (TIGR00299 family) protein
MKIATFEACSGIAGDMTVAALLDAGTGSGGATLDGLRGALAALALSDWSVDLRRVEVGALAASHFSVSWDASSQPHRDWGTIRGLIEAAGGNGLGEDAAARALVIFERLARAEAEVHEVALDRVHFHEVGGVDSIIDIVATAWCLERLGVQACFVGPIATGSGHVMTEHGRLPVPAPATALLLRGFDLQLGDGEGELVTPTGAAILAAEARPLRPAMNLQAVGNGAGTRRLADRPNVLRVFLGDADDADDENLVLLEADIDDMTPEALAYAAESLRARGARDVTVAPVAMKKGRLGMRLSVLSELGKLDGLSDCMLTETTTLGVRLRSVARRILAREVVVTETPWGPVAVKIGIDARGNRRHAPEFEDVARLARGHDVAFATVYEAALQAADNAKR